MDEDATVIVVLLLEEGMLNDWLFRPEFIDLARAADRDIIGCWYCWDWPLLIICCAAASDCDKSDMLLLQLLSLLLLRRLLSVVGMVGGKDDVKFGIIPPYRLLLLLILLLKLIQLLDIVWFVTDGNEASIAAA